MHKPHTPRRTRIPLLLALIAVSLPILIATPRYGAARAAATRQTAPTAAAPERERLLNGLSFFLLPQPGADKVTLRLRLHSGAAFDLAGKEGTTAILARSLFPDETTRSFVEEELGGELTTSADHDKIDVTLSGRADSLGVLLELLRNALVTPGALDAKIFESLRARHAAALTTARESAAALADEAIVRRLFGTYPLARPAAGTPDSVARLERADVIFARERFLAADNATLVIAGGFDPARARALVRQNLGAWRKADRLARATFRQPIAPPSETLVVPASDSARAEVRLALRAPSRADRDYPAALVLAAILRGRLDGAALNSTGARKFEVSYAATKLAGALVLGASAPASDAATSVRIARDALQKLGASAPSVAEVSAARLSLAAELSTAQTDALARSLLDADTYGVIVADTRARLDAVTPADVQALAAKLLSAGEPASVAAGDPAQLGTLLAQNGIKVELSGADASRAQNAPPPGVPSRSRDVPRSPLVPATPAATPGGKAPAAVKPAPPRP